MFKQTEVRSVLLPLAAILVVLAAMSSPASAEVVFDRGNDIYATNDDGSGLHLLYAANWVGMDGLGTPAVAPNDSTLLFRGTTFRNKYVTPHGNTVYGLNVDGTYELAGGQARRLDAAPAPARDPQGRPLAYMTGSETPEPAPGARYVYQAAQCTEYYNSGFLVWAVDCDHQLDSAPLSQGTAAATQLPSECDGTGSGVADPAPDPSSPTLRVAYVGCLSTPPNPLESPKGELIVTQSGADQVVATGADNSGFHDPSFSSDGTKIVAMADGGGIDDLDTGYQATVTRGLYLYSDLSHTTPGRLLIAAPDGSTTFSSPRFMGADRIVFATGGSVWSIPADCSSCSFPADATKLYDGGSDKTTQASSVAWTSGSITPGSPPTAARIAGLTRSMRLRTLLRKGLHFKVACAAACGVKATLVLDGKHARQLHLARARKQPRSVVVGRASRKLRKKGSISVRLHLSGKARKRLGRARSLKLTLRVVVTDAAGGHRTLKRSLKIRR